MADPIAQFRVYPGRGVNHFRERSLHWDVLLYATQEQMIEASKERSNEPPFEVEACVIHHNSQGRPARKLGWVFISIPTFDADAIAHESLHMASGYYRKRHGKAVGYLSAEKEETLAWATGNCAAQLVKGLWRRRAK